MARSEGVARLVSGLGATSLLIGSLAAAEPLPQSAQAPPPAYPGSEPSLPEPAPANAPSEDRWWESHVPTPRGSSQARTPLLAAGGALTGLGGLSIVGSGIAWLVAVAAAADLERECPNKRCVEGTAGERAYHIAHDSQRAGQVMLGLGLTSLSAGVVMLTLAIGADKKTAFELGERVLVQAGPTGAAMEVRF
jgi:hypothetical protein